MIQTPRQSLGSRRHELATVVAVSFFVAASTAPLFAQDVPPANVSAVAERSDDTTATDRPAESPPPETKNKNEKKGPSFIPVPIFVTEPAVGYGLGAALGYFHTSDSDDGTGGHVAPALTTGNPDRSVDRQKVPPTISGIAAAYTEKNTWVAGVGHMRSLRNDTIRYKGGAGYANVNAEFWLLDLPIEINLRGAIVVQDVLFRIGRSDFFAGAKLSYLNTTTGAKIDIGDLPIGLGGKHLQDIGLAAQLEYDARDNTMTPNRGLYAGFHAYKHFECAIGDFDYQDFKLQLQSFHQLAHDRLVLGLRLKLDAVSGDPPFWSYPWMDLRGVPALRYQNQRTGVVAAELRWNILDHWAAVAFAGTGATTGDVLLFEDERGIVAGGIGARYLFRPQDSLWVGVDVARGPEDTIFYIQVGQAWK